MRDVRPGTAHAAGLRALPPPRDSTPPWQTFCLACLGIALVGAIDVETGAAVHVVSLYFLPIVFAAIRLRRATAMGIALLATLVWLGALSTTAEQPLSQRVWAINFVTQGLAFVIVAQLVSRLSAALTLERQLRRTDALTGLRNRSALVEQASSVLALCRRQRRPVALIYLDLDRFKGANDRYGHGLGDELLRQAARGIGDIVREGDLAARVGGDEFVVLLPDADAEAACDVGRRIRRALDTSPGFVAAGVTVSLGVALDPVASTGLQGLLDQADRAMYAAKRARHAAQEDPASVSELAAAGQAWAAVVIAEADRPPEGRSSEPAQARVRRADRA